MTLPPLDVHAEEATHDSWLRVADWTQGPLAVVSIPQTWTFDCVASWSISICPSLHSGGRDENTGSFIGNTGADALAEMVGAVNVGVGAGAGASVLTGCAATEFAHATARAVVATRPSAARG